MGNGGNWALSSNGDVYLDQVMISKYIKTAL